MSFEYLLPSDAEHKFVEKAKEPTNPDYGFTPEKRPLDYYINTGVINLDKVAGPTSHEVASWVRKIMGLDKTGHGGTLDPHVTGVLPVALGPATKSVSSLLSAGKEYVCVMYLHGDVPVEKLKSVLQLFTTKLYQRPPIKSAVARRLRMRTLYYTQFLQATGRFVLFRVGCEAGTYIRKLCFDIGEALLCGAHMVELRRTRTGGFREDETFTLQDVKDAVYFWREKKEEAYIRRIITPMEKSIAHWKKIFIRDTAVDAIAHGASLAVAGVLYLDKAIERNDKVAIMTQKGELVAFGTSLLTAGKILKNSHGFCVKTEKVFMVRGLYPNWRVAAKEVKPEELTE